MAEEPIKLFASRAERYPQPDEVRDGRYLEPRLLDCIEAERHVLLGSSRYQLGY